MESITQRGCGFLVVDSTLRFRRASTRQYCCAIAYSTLVNTSRESDVLLMGLLLTAGRTESRFMIMLRAALATACLWAGLCSHRASALTASTQYSSLISMAKISARSIAGERSQNSHQAPRGSAWRAAGSNGLHTPPLPGSRRSPWARHARADGQGEEKKENDKPNLPGSGLRGVDTRYLQGSDKANAEWFQRTAEREARGQLAWYEDPVIYIALVGLVPLFILAWGVLNCYIPGFCESSF